MSGLSFLSVEPGTAGGSEPVWRSPLERALRAAPPHVRDVSQMGKFDVYGEFAEPAGAAVVRFTPTPPRALVFCAPGDTERVRRELGDGAVDVGAAFAGLEVHGERLMRRLTDLDLQALPAAGAVARIPGVVLRDGDTFRIFFPQEYADYLGAVVVDTAAGLA